MRTGAALAAEDSWATPFSNAMTLLMLAGAVVLFYVGVSDARARWFLNWLSNNLKVPAFFWGLLGLLGLTATTTATVLKARELFLAYRNPEPAGDQSGTIVLLIFLVGAVLASTKTLSNARRMYAAGAAARADRLRVLNPLSKLRTSEKLSSPSGRYLAFVFSLFMSAPLWLGTVAVYRLSEPAGSNVLLHCLSTSLLGLWLCGYARTSRSLTSPASMLVGIGLRVIGTAGCVLGLSLWTSSLLLFLFKEHAPDWWIYGFYGPVGMVLAGHVYHAGQDVLRYSRRHLTKIIRDPDDLDGESFVLYLRPFPNDALQASPQRMPWRGMMPLAGLFVTGRSEEERVAAALKKQVGPLVAVGEPGETLPYVGASRLYLPLHDWQDPVRKLMAQARMVVLSLGPGEGTMWELREALRTLPPERLVLLAPMGRDEYEEFRLRVQADLEEHDVRVRPRSRAATHVPVLPESTSRGSMPSVVQGAIYFSPTWTAEYVNLEDFALVSSAFFDRLPRALKAGLRPAVQQLAAHEFDPDRPADNPDTPDTPDAPDAPDAPASRERALVADARYQRAGIAAAAVLNIVCLAVALAYVPESGGRSSGEDDSKSPRTTGFNDATHQVVNKSSARGGTLKFVGTSDADSWDPQRTDYSFVRDFMRFYTRQLVTYRSAPGAKGHDLIPDLATSRARITNGGRTYTYRLKSGIAWEDGKPITSRDIKYGIERIWGKNGVPGGSTYLQEVLDPNHLYQGPYEDSGKQGLKSIETPDDRTIVFRLPQPNGAFEQMLAMPAGSPVRKDKDSKAAYGRRPFSSGPYKWRSYRPGKSLTLIRNDAWKRSTDRARTALPDKITLTMFTDSAKAERELLSGKYDLDVVGWGVGQNGYDAIIRRDRGATFDNPYNGYLNFAALVRSVKPFGNIHCRRAVIHGADLVAARDASATSLVADIATHMMPTVVPGSDPAYDPFGIARNRGKPDTVKARSELEKCGNPNGFKTTIAAAAGNDEETAIARSLQTSLGKIGIRAEIDTYEGAWAATVGDPGVVRKRNYGIIVSGWAPDLPSAQGVLPRLVHSKYILPTGNFNYSTLKDPALDKRLDAAAAEADPHKSAADYEAINKMISEHAVFLPVTLEKVVRWRNPRLTNVHTTDSFNGLYDYASLGVTS
ncbi:ABC transporter substrate-binding protein [Streptomyces sporangiiformans]|uniref:ABC transporter substrate-binding protein n=1 Tax=Streptomyces sporangiiformans TaxID=2315329 RepID=A0A505DBJ5_9ACTN|nr:ABC transporter substrate-binding protein [Streptomyces sporangiiformans]TPQ21883.1 ABC transporter substrate-binding protein [Streptomyces sporangiiformans]